LPPDEESHSRTNGKTTEGQNAGFPTAGFRTTVLGKDFKGALTLAERLLHRAHIRFPDVLVVLLVKLEGCIDNHALLTMALRGKLS
jgi:hypothetical protein